MSALICNSGSECAAKCLYVCAYKRAREHLCASRVCAIVCRASHVYSAQGRVRARAVKLSSAELAESPRRPRREAPK